MVPLAIFLGKHLASRRPQKLHNRNMVERILLATDGSEYARAPEALAEYLAYRLEANLCALFVKDSRAMRQLEVLDFGALTVPIATYREELERALTRAGEAALARLAQSAQVAGVRFEPKLLSGIPYEVIAKEARAFDLLVLGRAGEGSGHEPTGIGSNAGRLVRTAEVPVMVSPLAYTLPERVLVGYDGSKLSLRALHVAADLAVGLELPAVVASMDDDLEAADRLASEGAEYLVNRGISVQTNASKGDPAARLSELQEASDILTLGSFGRGTVREFLLGSTTEYLLRHALGPVLLVR